MFKNSILLLRLLPNEIFCSDHIDRNLDVKSVRNGTITMSAQIVLFLLNIARMIVLARILTPKDFGLIGMVTVFTTFAVIFRDAGLPVATIQKKIITPNQINSLFWVNFLISLIFGLSMIASAPVISNFYNQPELRAVTIVLSFPLFFQGLFVQHSALLRRHMRFTPLMVIKITASFIGASVAITLAVMGWNYWALVYSTVASSLTTMLTTFFFCPWLPKRNKIGPEVLKFLKFGGHITIFNIVNFFTRNFDNILIGKYLGADCLGLYAKAYSTVYLPIDNLRAPITNVALPVCSRIKSNDFHIRSYARKYIFLLAFFAMPLMMFSFLFSKEIIIVVFGQNWIAMNPLLKFFAIAGFIQTPANVKGLLLLSCGKSKEYMYQGIAVSFVFLTSFIIGLKWGVIGVSAAYAISSYIIQPPTFLYSCRHTPLQVKDFISSVYIPLLISIFAGIVTWYFNLIFIFNNFLFKSFLMFVLYILSYIALFMIFPGGMVMIRNNLINPMKRGLFTKNFCEAN